MEVQNAKVWGLIPDKDLNIFLSLAFMVRQVTSFLSLVFFIKVQLLICISFSAYVCKEHSDLVKCVVCHESRVYSGGYV